MTRKHLFPDNDSVIREISMLQPFSYEPINHGVLERNSECIQRIPWTNLFSINTVNPIVKIQKFDCTSSSDSIQGVKGVNY